ncbi:MAG TPA: hypothetical protein VLT33_24075 [Labilithrix sp.]|nr:hypothetical protein [Labilithrix sp.]
MLFFTCNALVLLFGFAPEVSSVLPELELLDDEELLELDLPEHESDLLSSLLSSVLSQPDESLVLPELELLDDDELLELLLEEELPELSPLLDELSPDELSPDEPLELSPLLEVELLEDVAVVVSPPQLSSSFVVELVVPVLEAPQPSSATTSSSPSSS